MSMKKTLTACTTVALLGTCSIAQAAVITPTGVTASSEYTADGRVASQLTDNSGLTVADLTGDHGIDVRNTMWMSAGSPSDQNPELIFDLGAAYDLTDIHIWAYNEAGGWAGNPDQSSRGAKDIDVYGSTDGGTSYSLLESIIVTKGTGSSDVPVQTFTLASAAIGVDFIRFDIGSNHNSATYVTDLGGTFGAGTEAASFVGLSEVKFTGTMAVPEPATLSLILLSFGGMLALRRRSKK